MSKKNLLKKQLLLFALAMDLSLVGCNSVDELFGFDNEAVEEITTDTLIPESYYNSYDLNSDTTIADLKNISYLLVSPKDTSSVDWIQYCDNINSLDIHNYQCNYKEWDIITQQLNSIDFTKFEELDNVSIMLHLSGSSISFDEDNFKFLKAIPNLKELSISSNWINKDFIESFKKIEKLRLFSTSSNIDLDYTKLPNLKQIDFSVMEPYSLAIFLTTEDLNYFKKNNIELVLEDDSYYSKIIAVNNKLDLILDKINIEDSDSDKEKLRKISTYILDNLSYDEEVAELLESNYNLDDIDNSKFYKEGLLYGALECNTQICGNYSALLRALGKRVGLDIYNISSYEHTWNIIKLDENYYFIDLTFLDNDELSKYNLREGNIEKVDYYLMSLDDIVMRDSSHFTVDILEPAIKESKIYVYRIKEFN